MAYCVKSPEEYKEILNTNQAVLVDFYAKWCKPCTQVSPHVDELQKSYPNVKIIKVDYDEFETIIQDETVEKLPTFKAFFKGESIGHHVGIKLEQIQALLTQLNQRVSSTTENGTQSTAVVQDAKTTAPAAHPALSILANDTILKGSRALPHLTPTPQELIDFKASLSNYAIVVFYSAKDDVTTSSTPQMKSTLSNNTVIQLFNDLKLLQDRFSNDAHKIEIRRIKIDQNEPNTMILAKEYGCDDNDLPVVKMMYKSTVWATVRNGNAFEVEAKLPEFVQL